MAERTPSGTVSVALIPGSEVLFHTPELMPCRNTVVSFSMPPEVKKFYVVVGLTRQFL